MIKGLKRGVHRQVLGAFLAQLQGHPYFANNRVVKTWITWDGKTPVAEPTTDMMPAVMLRMVGSPAKRLTSQRRPGGPMLYAIQTNPQVFLDCWTPGTDQSDLADLGDLIFDALFPQDPAERAALEKRFRLAGIHDWDPKRLILPLSAESFDLSFVAGSGSIELILHLSC